jgi:hypothetical protein
MSSEGAAVSELCDDHSAQTWKAFIPRFDRLVNFGQLQALGDGAA